MRVDLIVGTRPNFVKAASLHRALRACPDVFDLRLVHTGQHYDSGMSEVFFRELGLPAPDVALRVGSGSPGAQIGEIMSLYDQTLAADPAALVLVVGDVSSTVGCALAAVHRGAAVGHVEAGLRSFDRTMPEEVNRVVTDRVSDFLFIASPDARENLLREGTPAGQIFLVGNVLIDTLHWRRAEIQRSAVLRTLGLEPRRYGVVTLHRPSNVDDAARLVDVLEALATLRGELDFVFPVHPRTRQALAGLDGGVTPERFPNLRFVEPFGYTDFLALVSQSLLVVTDSGGLQEETTAVDVPCLTLRENTERPITISEGTNLLIGHSRQRLLAAVRRIFAGGRKLGTCPALWDGAAAPRIVDVLRAYDRGEVRRRPWGPPP